MKIIPKNSICLQCTRYILGWQCLAFEEIPDEIIDGINKHNKPLPNQDNDIVFEENK